MRAIADIADIKQQWEEKGPVEVRFGHQWRLAAVVGISKRRGCIDCRMLEDVEVILGPKGFLGSRPNSFVYEKGDIVSKPASTQYIRRRVNDGPTSSACVQGETVESHSSSQRWKPTLLEYALFASLIGVAILGYFTNSGH
jgi:hypothetical protein